MKMTKKLVFSVKCLLFMAYMIIGIERAHGGLIVKNYEINDPNFGTDILTNRTFTNRFNLSKDDEDHHANSKTYSGWYFILK